MRVYLARTPQHPNPRGRGGGSNQPYHRKQSRVAGQSGSMYVDRATFIDDQFCKYIILESTTPIALYMCIAHSTFTLGPLQQPCPSFFEYQKVRVSCARLSPGCQGSRGTSRTRRGPSIFSWGGYPSKLLPASTTGRHRNNLTRWQPLISIEIC